MEAFLLRKNSKSLAFHWDIQERPWTRNQAMDDLEDSTDLKLATLVSLFPDVDQATLLDLLISADGSVEVVKTSLYTSTAEEPKSQKRSAASIGYQTSLSAFRRGPDSNSGSSSTKRQALTRKGQTLHLYNPEDVATHTPCSIVHGFLPSQQADDLLRELLQEAPTFERQTFKLFDNVVQSPHSACFYVDSLKERELQKTEYLYNGQYLSV